ncbi:hypothetical protein BIW11_03122 [Tropilaelaps mercedesae]|uniref:Uncharacterized protein n=1 Tax=Tropilaelaps mercedesae TaxID=418985 RepID=A0A1V9XRU0_9ACAR|nr:hypothetical protein BIW11_03122 [Tropilaelaps mercedesae]
MAVLDCRRPRYRDKDRCHIDVAALGFEILSMFKSASKNVYAPIAYMWGELPVTRVPLNVHPTTG